MLLVASNTLLIGFYIAPLSHSSNTAMLLASQLLSPVQNTTLWQRLNGSDTQLLSANVSQLCTEAANRMRGFASLHSQYTLHDEVHLLRVTELMALIIPAEVLQALNPIELALLILAAHFHDQGMVPDREELATWRDDAPNPDPKFLLFRQNWAIEHPNLEAARRQANDPALSTQERERARRVEADLLDALLSDYLRQTHGERAATWLKATYSQDARLVVQNTNLTDALARLCQSHVGEVSALTDANGFRVDERIGVYSVNMVYLALILRLADILDFDRERTPDSLYRTIDFRSPISLTEWGKHRSVTGWDISPDAVQFTLECEHPEYERAARRFMDYIDDELQNATQRIREFPKRAAQYSLDLPVKTDRSRIKPKDNAYIYHDLEFSLSRDEVVKLLMTDKLYGSPSLCVRELLQNSLDALRHRTAQFKRSGVEWHEGKVEMFHEVDGQGHEVVRCVDNGIGMTRDIVLNFLTKAGRSYYRSPQFEQERIGLRAAGVDFDPCAQFGIGFMSVFMLGDHVVIHTRRDNGPTAGYGEPLIIEINGIGGIVVLRPGRTDQPAGTTVTITGRKKPRFMDTYVDKVELISLLTTYAIATEFPIEATCTVPGIKNSIKIPPIPTKPQTLMEVLDLHLIKTFEQKFEEINPLISGISRVSFLTNENSELVLQNKEAYWKEANLEEYDEEPSLNLNNTEDERHDIIAVFRGQYPKNSPIALDGILVAGRGGREDLAPRRYRPSERQYGTINSSFLRDDGYFTSTLDIRGTVKPPLTPAREPYSTSNKISTRAGRWEAVRELMSQVEGRLWEKVAHHLNAATNPELFWQLGMIYGKGWSWFAWMRASICWKYLAVPVLGKEDKHEWVTISSLGKLYPREPINNKEHEDYVSWSEDDYILYTEDNRKINTYEALTRWGTYYDLSEVKDDEHPDPAQVISNLNDTVLCLSTLFLEVNSVILQVLPPISPEEIPHRNNLSLYSINTGDLFAIRYAGEALNFFSVHAPCRTINRTHPLSQIILQGVYADKPTEFEEFSTQVAVLLSNSDAQGELKQPLKHMERKYRKLGALFLDVNWAQVSLQYHPPYQIRLLDGNTVSITKEVFESWANAEAMPGEEGY
jgi:hypothetical protein